MADRRHRQWLAWVVVAAVATAGVGNAQERPPKPADEKSAAATTRPSPKLAKVQALLNQLAADSSQAREAARIALMGLDRADLGVLREAVKQSVPLAPSQIAVLREIVTQVYLAGDDYPAQDDESGFLGVSLPSGYSLEDRGLAVLPQGVPIVSRVPGFAAYRMLQNGDVILSMTNDGEETKFASSQDFIDTVRQVKAGKSVTFELIRQGRVIKVPITLGRRPAVLDGANPNVLKEFTNRRADAADEMWQRDFAPLIGELVG